MEITTDMISLKLVLEVLTIIFALAITYSLFTLATKHRKESMSRTYYFMSIAFFVFSIIQFVGIVDFLPNFPWDLLKLVTELLFMIIIFYSVTILSKTIAAYDFLRMRQKKTRDTD